MNPRRLFSVVATISMLLGANALAQRGAPVPNTISVPGSSNPTQPWTQSTGTIIQLEVRDEKRKPLDRQALVQITNKTTGQIQGQVTQGDAMATIIDLQMGLYDVAVSALGYMTAHLEVTINGSVMTNHMEVVL